MNEVKSNVGDWSVLESTNSNKGTVDVSLEHLAVKAWRGMPSFLAEILH